MQRRNREPGSRVLEPHGVMPGRLFLCRGRIGSEDAICNEKVDPHPCDASVDCLVHVSRSRRRLRLQARIAHLVPSDHHDRDRTRHGRSAIKFDRRIDVYLMANRTGDGNASRSVLKVLMDEIIQR